MYIKQTFAEPANYYWQTNVHTGQRLPGSLVANKESLFGLKALYMTEIIFEINTFTSFEWKNNWWTPQILTTYNEYLSTDQKAKLVNSNYGEFNAHIHDLL